MVELTDSQFYYAFRFLFGISLSMDDTDRQLIELLRANARLSHVELGRQLGVSRATVQNRMRRLEKSGDIVGYTVRTRSGAAPAAVRAFVSIATDAHAEAAVVRRLEALPTITALHHAAGHWDLIAEAAADSLTDFHRLVGEIRALRGVARTETNLLLDTQTYAAGLR
ncbi:MAG: Lrp/AsnC family transcriptional regulator [Pseudomonadota bacterium]